jgi:hypothetical protein
MRPPEARFVPRPLPGDPDWYVFELIAIQRAATATLQARMAKVQLGQDYPGEASCRVMTSEAHSAPAIDSPRTPKGGRHDVVS